jgi:hypothetical protein
MCLLPMLAPRLHLDLIRPDLTGLGLIQFTLVPKETMHGH